MLAGSDLALATVWQAALTAPEVHHEHPVRSWQEASEERALQVSSSGPLMAFMNFSMSSSISSGISSKSCSNSSEKVFSSSRGVQAKMLAGSALALATVWQAALTAPEVHHEHPVRSWQDASEERALQVSSSGPLETLISLYSGKMVVGSSRMTVSVLASTSLRLEQAKMLAGSFLAFSTEWQAGLTAPDVHQEQAVSEWQPMFSSALQVSSTSP